MTTTEYAKKIVDLIAARPPRIDMDRLLYEIYVQAMIVEGRRDIDEGRWTSNEQVMEGMWEIIHSQSDGQIEPNKISTKRVIRTKIGTSSQRISLAST